MVFVGGCAILCIKHAPIHAHISWIGMRILKRNEMKKYSMARDWQSGRDWSIKKGVTGRKFYKYFQPL